MDLDLSMDDEVSPISSPSRCGLLTGMYPGKWHITTYLQGKAGNKAAPFGINSKITVEQIESQGCWTQVRLRSGRMADA